MREVVLIGGDILSPLGNLHSTWDNILSGRSGIFRRKFGSLKGRYPLGIIGGLPGESDSWDRLRSMFDHLFVDLPPLPEKTLLFCATTKAAVDELLHEKTNIDGQPWQIADYLARYLGLTEGGTMVSGACASGSLAVARGAMRIAAGECDHALIVGFDMVTEFTLSGFDSMKALSPEGAKPFDKNRNGLTLADGAGWILLASGDCVRTGENILARLGSWAISCDATHITAPCRRGSGLIAALERIKEEITVPIGGINAHGTGTVYNDAMELLVFGERCEPGIPICSVKGALGHSLGAAGVVETLLSTMSLHHNILPPTIGLDTSETTSCTLSGVDSHSLLFPSILTCNSGFGGINAVLFLTK